MQRGTIDAETAKRAATLLAQGKRIEILRFPFDEVVIDDSLQEIIDVKKEVEQVRHVPPFELQGADTVRRKW